MDKNGVLQRVGATVGIRHYAAQHGVGRWRNDNHRIGPCGSSVIRNPLVRYSVQRNHRVGQGAGTTVGGTGKRRRGRRILQCQRLDDGVGTAAATEV